MKPCLNLFLRSASLAAILGLGGMQSAQAANYWWDGTTGNWDDLTMWSTTATAGGADPTAAPLATISDALTFNTTGTNADAIIYLNGNRGDVNKTSGITINNNGTTTFSGGTLATPASQTLSSSGITVSAGAGAVTFSGGTAAVGIRMGSSNTIANNSTNLLTIRGSLGSRGTSGTPNFTLGGTGNMLFSGVIGQGGTNANVAVTKTGVGVLTLSGTNLYNGGTTISAGTLTFLNKSAKATAGTANHVFAAGTTLGLGVATTGNYYTSTDITNAFAGSGVLTGNLTRISVTATTNVGIDTTAGDFELSTSIAGAPTKGLAKLGTNTLTLSAANTYTGVTTVRVGTLKVASGGVINEAATSGGTGVVIGESTLDLDGGIVHFTGGTALAVGDNTTAGNVIVRSGSTLNLTGAIAIGQGATGVGNTPVSTFTQLGGTTMIGASSILYLGNYRGAVMNIQGGTLTSSSAVNIGVRGNSTLTISGETTAVSFSQVNLGLPAGSLLPTADLNLNGGTLTLGENGITKAVTDGTKTVSFNGGTLKASATSTDFVNADFVYVKSGGATIDTDAFDVTIDHALLPFESSTGGLTKTGSGTLTLSNANTYAGNTDVRTGTLVLAAASSQKFYPKADATSNKITDTNPIDTEPVPVQGVVTLDGAFAIDLTAAAAAPSGSEWLLVDVANLAETYGSTFAVTDFTETPADSGIWKKTESSNIYTFTESTGKLSLEVSTLTGFSSWITGSFNGNSVPSGMQGPEADPDNDGIANLLEFVLNSDPTVSSPASLPTLDASGANFVFTFARRDDSLSPETTQTFQYGSNLSDWTDVIVPAANATVGAATITITDGSPTDSIQISIPKSEAPAGKLFGRLKATKP